MNKYQLSGFKLSSNYNIYSLNNILPKGTKSSINFIKDTTSIANNKFIGSTLTELVEGMHTLKINLVDQGQRRNNGARTMFKYYTCSEDGHHLND